MARFFIICGEDSGDRLGALIGSGLVTDGHDISGWGGIQMSGSNIHLTRDISDLKVMGWSQVLTSLPKIIRLWNRAKRDILEFQPDKLILIDYGGFNLRIAKWAYSRGIEVVYYSPPKIWASRPGRIKYLHSYCHKIIVLFPFEQRYYESRGLQVEYFGHPLAQEIHSHASNEDFRSSFELDKRPILSILPGSRRSEIEHTLPIYLRAAKELPEYQVCISVISSELSLVSSICESANVAHTLIVDNLYGLLSHTALALVTSGTATFETALFKIPQVVGYKTSWINYRLAKRLIRVEHVSLPNLIAGKAIIPELIQNELNPQNLQKNIIRICQPDAKSEIENAYSSIIFDTFKEKCLFKTIAAISS